MANQFDVEVVNPLQALLLGKQSYDSAIENNKKQAVEAARNEAGRLYAAGDTKGALSRLLMGGDLQGAGTYSGLDQNQWTRTHTEGRDKVADQHWSADYGLRKAANARANDKTPAGWIEDATAPGGYRGIGPNDPVNIQAAAEAKARAADPTPLREAQLARAGIDKNSPEGQAFLLSGEWTGPGTGGASLNPVYGTVGGKPAMVQTTKTGKAIQTQLPEGFEIAREPIKIDTGTSIILLDPQTRQLIRETPKNPAELERQKTIGDEIAKAQKNHPQNVAAGQQILKTISDIENDPALSTSVGSLGSIPAFPGSPGANFNAKAAQLKGQTFLQAYSQLKGGGAITDIEGTKGENAIARMDRAQNEKEYRAALKDFREVIKGGLLRSAAMARGEIGPPKADAAPQATSAADPLGIR